MPHLVGTAGYVYPHWRRTFYPPTTPQKSELSYYLSHFPTVEINATWHAFPRATTLSNWRSAATPHTRFSLKAPALITHTKRLQNASEDITSFLKLTTDALEHHLAVILFQTPPSLPYSIQLLTDFLQGVNNALQTCTHTPRIALEFRNRSYFCDSVYALLKTHNVALVNNVIVSDTDFTKIDDAHFPHCRNIECERTAWTYTRFHGSKNPGVATKYPDSVLRPFAELIKDDVKETHFAFFLNDLQAEAPKSARRYIELLAGGGKVGAVLGGFVPVWAKKKRGIDAFFGGGKKGGTTSNSPKKNLSMSASPKKSLSINASPRKGLGVSPKKSIVKDKRKAKIGTIGSFFAAKSSEKG